MKFSVMGIEDAREFCTLTAVEKLVLISEFIEPVTNFRLAFLDKSLGVSGDPYHGQQWPDARCKS